MIAQNIARHKKYDSLCFHKDIKQDKQNFNVNIEYNNAKKPPFHYQRMRPSLLPGLNASKNMQYHLLKVQANSKEQQTKIHKNLQKQYSQSIRSDYSLNILNHLKDKPNNLKAILHGHSIPPQLRSKMVDWMVQVLSSYKMSEQCFFRSIKYMDIYFNNTRAKLQAIDLHLVGVVSMFIAAKYQQIHPLKLNVIYDKICRKKFSKSQILEMQQQIISCLSFQLQQVTSYDILSHLKYQMNFRFNQKITQYFNKVSLYLMKLAMYSQELIQANNTQLALSVLFLSLKTVQQVTDNLQADKYLTVLAEQGLCSTDELLVLSQKLLNEAKIFSVKHPTLKNLKKFNNAQYQQ